MSNSYCKTTCTIFAAAASIIIGIITLFLRITGFLTVPTALLWVGFGIAVGFAVISFIAALRGRFTDIRDNTIELLTLLFTGILGTLLSSVLLLSVTISPTGIIGSIAVGLFFAFASLIFSSAACIVKNIVRNG